LARHNVFGGLRSGGGVQSIAFVPDLQ